MSDQTVHIRGRRRDLMAALRSIPSAAEGNGEAKEAADAMYVRCGLTLLGRIRHAFVVKSHGGTDEAGEKWAPLSPKTIAYSRRHPGLPRASVRAAKRPSYALNAKQRKRWWAVYSQNLARYKGDKGHAAAVAWLILKSEGAETLLMRYGSTQVDILRDTGLLLNSLTPGVPNGGMPAPVKDQVFVVGQGEVIVGTNRKGAAAHHNGIPGKLPQRRLWPEPSKWPSSWWQDIAEAARDGLVDITLHLLGRAA